VTQIPTHLLEPAREAAANAYAPYSGFAVGAVVETTDGRLFAAANMENASYGLSICAETGALQAASTAGALGSIKRMAVVGGPLTPPADYRPRATPPCGRCRQLIFEAAALSGCDIEIWFADLNGDAAQHRTISELLPDAFGRDNVSS
jgi:cytidine deaminase